MDCGCPGLRKLDPKVLSELDNPVINPLEGRLRFLRLPRSCFQFLKRFLKAREGRYELRARLSQSLRTNGQAGEEVAKDRGRLFGLLRKCGTGIGPGALSGVAVASGLAERPPPGASHTGGQRGEDPEPRYPRSVRGPQEQDACRQSRDD